MSNLKKDEAKSAFAVFSSLYLQMAKESFPMPCSISAENISDFSDKFGLYKLVDLFKEALSPTLDWLISEEYLKADNPEDPKNIVLTEKGAKSIGLEIPSATVRFKIFATVDNKEVFFSARGEDGWIADEKLKIQGPAINFIPDPSHWLGN